MVEIIASIIFLISIAGILLTVARRMPALSSVPAPVRDENSPGFWLRVRSWSVKKILSLPYFKGFSWQASAQKILAKGKVLALKAENKINDYMEKLRQGNEKSLEQTHAQNDAYWKELTSLVKSKNIDDHPKGKTVMPREPEKNPDIAGAGQEPKPSWNGKIFLQVKRIGDTVDKMRGKKSQKNNSAPTLPT